MKKKNLRSYKVFYLNIDAISPFEVEKWIMEICIQFDVELVTATNGYFIFRQII